MKWARTLLTGVVLLATSVPGGAVDCDNAFTRVEQAICGNPALMQAQRQLAALADAAADAGQIERADRVHDDVAHFCRRSTEMSQCLLNVTRQRIVWLSNLPDNQSDTAQTIVEANF